MSEGWSRELLADIYRREVGRCTATLIRVLGDVDRAEDAVAEAFVVAAERWSVDGVPANPGGWITTTARNRAIDRLRTESARRRREEQVGRLAESRGDHLGHLPMTDAELGPYGALGELDVVPDDQLRLIFLCCHPALGADAQVALTLRLVAGLTTTEIARAFLVPVPTMGQRISRAKRKIRDNHVAYRIPSADELPARLDPVLATAYLIFTEGHNATAGASLIRRSLVDEAIRLARTLARLLPDEPEVVGLLALLVLSDARTPARLDGNGNLVRLPDQDRDRWDRELVDEGLGLVRWCLERNRPGPYQLQAAINAVHTSASAAADTDWGQIVVLYDHLMALRPNPMVALNRAIAVLELDGPEAALAELEAIDLPTYHLYHATRAEALKRAGRTDDAATALQRAIALCTNEVEERHLRRELERLG